MQLDMFEDRGDHIAVESTSEVTAAMIEPAVAASSLPMGSNIISDAGEELVANRRNHIRTAYRWADVAGMNDALKVRETTKANIWSKPDYQKLIDEGMQPIVAHIVKQVYDSIAPKPAPTTQRPVLDDQVLQQYFEILQRIEAGVGKWQTDKDALLAWTQSNIKQTGAMLGRRIEISELIKPANLLEYIFPEGWRENREAFMLAGGNRLLGALQPGYDEVKRATKAIDAGWPKKREAWEVQGMRLLDHPEGHVRSPEAGVFALYIDKNYIDHFKTQADAEQAKAAVKPYVLFDKRRMLGSFDTEEKAISFAKEKARGAKGKADISDKGVKVESAERVGPSRRMEGEDISSERLLEEFSLKGVNFGNWLKNPAARAEAQLHLNHAYDSFHDLAETLGIPPKAISLNGMLGLAIGAQGHGGRASAHFVPGVNEINMTRESGAGFLGHEYAHAVDHYYATQGGLSTSTTPYLSEHAELGITRTLHQREGNKFVEVTVPRFGDTRPEVVAAFKTIMEKMTKRPQTVEEAQANIESSNARTRKNIESWLSAIRRDFKDQEQDFDVLAAKVRSGELGEGSVAVSSSTYLSPVLVSMRDLYKTKHGRLYPLDNLKGLQANLHSLAFRASQPEPQTDRPPRMVSTEYVRNAAQMDDEKGGKPYWSTKCELFARAFDAYLADRLDAKAELNTYLTTGVHERRTVPVGEDRKAINAAFGNLIETLRVRETERGPALFSVGASQTLPSLPLSTLHAEIERMRGQWKTMPPVVVVGSTAELDFDVYPHADGAYYEGTVYVVASNVASIEQLQKVMAHECVMHHDLEEMLGDYGFSKLHTGIQALKTGGDPTICSIADDIRTRYGTLPPDQETKEIVARAGEMCLDGKGEVKVEFGFMKSVFANVAGWLRDHGMTVPFTNLELQGILHKAGQWGKQEPEQGVASGRTQLSGLFSGKILSVGNGVVTQKVGRGGETVLHSLKDLTGSVNAGEVTDILYKDGRGTVAAKERQRGLSR
ncbi:MAG: LPD1 domain-containing protein [Pseudomonadota bacterium]